MRSKEVEARLDALKLYRRAYPEKSRRSLDHHSLHFFKVGTPISKNTPKNDLIGTGGPKGSQDNAKGVDKSRTVLKLSRSIGEQVGTVHAVPAARQQKMKKPAHLPKSGTLNESP